MPYTLSMALLWVVLAAVIGLIIGWLLRSVTAKRQIERARSANLGTAEREELAALRASASEATALVAERDRLAAELEQERTAAPTAETGASTDLAGLGASEELVEASRVLGRPVVADDLTVIDGIGEQVSELCRGIGIVTWADLAATEVSLLRTMLTDAGPRVKSQDPTSWPDQAALLDAGRWSDFVQLVEGQAAGRASD